MDQGDAGAADSTADGGASVAAGGGPPRDRAWVRRLFPVLLLLVTICAYVPAIEARWIWDDDHYVTHNRPLFEEGGLARIWTDPTSIPQWYPVVHTTFWVERRLWGLDPMGYHVVNILLHAANALLLAAVLRRLRLPGARLAGLLFALHPVQVESVAWITERKNVLSGLFYLGALLAWLRFEGLPGEEASARRPARWWWLAAGLFVLALLSKSVTATLPCVAAVVLWATRGRLTARAVAPLVPLLVLGVGLGLHTAMLEREHVGAEGEDWAFTAVERLLIAGRALWHYARTLVWPVGLVFIYPRWTLDASAWWQYLFPAAAAGGVLGLWLARGRIGRWPAAAAFCFAGTLVPALGFFNVYPMRYSFVADHFQYLACAALLAAAAAAMVALRRRLEGGGGGAARVPARVPEAAVLLLLAAGTFQRCRAYEDEDTLWNDVLDRNPTAWIALTNVGARFLDEGDLVAAEAYARRAVELGPRSHETWNNLGKALYSQGRLDEAAEALERALSIMPGFLTARTNLGVVWAERGDPRRAEECYREVLALKDDFPLALGNLMVLMVAEGRSAEAVALGARAVGMHPGDARIRTAYGRALADEGREREGLAQMSAAVRADPRFGPGWSALGRALHAHGDIDRAVQALRQAVALSPADAEALNNLGVALRAAGRTAEAEDAYKRSLVLDPSSVDVWGNLARLLESVGRDEHALACWERALAIRPAHGPALEGRGILRARAGAWGEAAEDLRAAAAGGGATAAGLRALLALLSGGPDPALHDAGGAAEVADRLLAAVPDPSAEDLALAARALAGVDRRPEAAALLQRALALPEAAEGTDLRTSLLLALDALR